MPSAISVCVGATYGAFTLLEVDIPSTRGRMCRARCACGSVGLRGQADVVTGRVRQCKVCYQGQKERPVRRTHFMCNSPEWNSWRAMRERCNNPKYHAYHRYGGRGIRVYLAWDCGGGGFEAFYAHVGPKPGPEYTLERIDGDKDYVPGNVVWGTKKVQGRNKVNNRRIVAFNKTQCLAAWAEETGTPRATLAERLARGVDPETALSFSGVITAQRHVRQEVVDLIHALRTP